MWKRKRGAGRETDEYERAREGLRLAWENFDRAEGEYVEVAIYDIKAAEKRMENVLNERSNG